MKPPSDRRVLFLAPYLGDGGINTHMLTLGRALRQRGWDVAVCSGGSLVDRGLSGAGTSPRQRAEPIPEDYQAAGIAHLTVRFPFMPHRLRELPQLLRVPLAIWQVLRAVQRFRPAVIHCHSRQMGIYARLARLLLGVPFVSTVHNPITSTNRFWGASTLLGARAMAVSGEIAESLVRQHRMPPERVRVVTPGADADHFRPPNADERQSARQRHGIEPGQFVMVFIGSLTANKQPGMLVEAVAELAASTHDVVVLVAGKGPEEQALRLRADELGVGSRVLLLGYQDARGVLWAADALVLPSRSEGFGLVIVEAMLSGVVVLATPAGGAARRLIPGVTGFVFESGDHAELARLVRQLIEQPELRTAIGVRARDDARAGLSSAAMARTVEETYHLALRQQAARPHAAR